MPAPLFFVEDADGCWPDRHHHEVSNIGKLISDWRGGQFTYDGKPPKRVIQLHPDGTWEDVTALVQSYAKPDEVEDHPDFPATTFRQPNAGFTL